MSFMHSISYGMNESEEIIRVAGPSAIVKVAITYHDGGITFIYSYQQTTLSVLPELMAEQRGGTTYSLTINFSPSRR